MPFRAKRGVKKLLLPPLALFLLGWASGCDPGGEDPQNQPSSPSGSTTFDEITAPEFWVYGSTRFLTLQATLTLGEDSRQAIYADELDPPRVTVRITDGGSDTLAVDLLDDGGQTSREGLPDYVHPNSGDLVPYDFVYTARINALFAPEPAEYELHYLLYWPDPYTLENPLAVTVESALVAINSPPEITAVDAPQELPSGFREATFSATVTDPDLDAGDELEVEMLLLADETEMRRLLLAEDAPGHWSLAADSTFAAELPTDEYTLSFLATDRFRERSEAVNRNIWIENTAPILTGIVAPDTVYRPAEQDTNRYDFFVDVLDRQGQDDLLYVYYDVIDPRGNRFDGVQSNFFFRDDGLLNDETAEDGIWSQRFEVNNSVSNFGLYTFILYARDRADNLSDPSGADPDTTYIQLMDIPGGAQ